MNFDCKILFIGNSHTYFNDMPYILQYLTAVSAAPTAQTTLIAHGGKTFGQHKDEPEVRYNILYGGYDYVVLQQAAHPFDGERILLRDGKPLAELICQAGAVPVSYMTWAQKAHPENQQEMIDAYRALQREVGGILAPVGLIWQAVRDRVDLFFRDGEHANPTGSYLAACTLYASIFQKTPVGLPNVILHHGEIVAEIEPRDAALIQKTIAEIVL